MSQLFRAPVGSLFQMKAPANRKGKSTTPIPTAEGVPPPTAAVPITPASELSLAAPPPAAAEAAPHSDARFKAPDAAVLVEYKDFGEEKEEGASAPPPDPASLVVDSHLPSIIADFSAAVEGAVAALSEGLREDMRDVYAKVEAARVTGAASERVCGRKRARIASIVAAARAKLQRVEAAAVEGGEPYEEEEREICGEEEVDEEDGGL